MKIYIMGLNGKPEKECINLNKLMIEFAEKIGLRIKIIGMISVLDFIENYFDNKGYEVIKCRAKYNENKEIHKLGLSKSLEKASIEKGVPDYFCYKNKDDWFFVEAKSQNDGLRISQVKWIIKNKSCKTKVIYGEEDNGENEEEKSDNKDEKNQKVKEGSLEEKELLTWFENHVKNFEVNKRRINRKK